MAVLVLLDPLWLYLQNETDSSHDIVPVPLEVRIATRESLTLLTDKEKTIRNW